MEDSFNELTDNLQIDNYDDINTSLEGIAKKLNQKYYDNSTAENYLIVGSMGRSTPIKGESDIPKPYDIYWKVRNVGYEAIRRNCIRGQIKKGNYCIMKTS